ncbi:uncharacterized protein LOC130986047 [Salvia miltiorrhiza]|uniref:uncharacterized protein LOC130986047 n=1 Tax=Salvia miltiorrhiza TaxID=226208 RepID=UPI0025ACC27A|nr:uncharacterized protein LOC130986047 [Salvia miltiorrhiza]
MEVKPIPAITKGIIKACLIKEMVPVFKAKWPKMSSRHIFIQINILMFQLVCQPANSPDTNVNDLGFFRAIQTLKDQKAANNVEELLENVKAAYEEYHQSSSTVFFSLCKAAIMK